MSYLGVNSMSEMQLKIASICSNEFWCDVLVWIDIEDNLSVVKSIYKSALSDETGQVEFTQAYPG